VALVLDPLELFDITVNYVSRPPAAIIFDSEAIPADAARISMRQWWPRFIDDDTGFPCSLPIICNRNRLNVFAFVFLLPYNPPLLDTLSELALSWVNPRPASLIKPPPTPKKVDPSVPLHWLFSFVITRTPLETPSLLLCLGQYTSPVTAFFPFQSMK